MMAGAYPFLHEIRHFQFERDGGPTDYLEERACDRYAREMMLDKASEWSVAAGYPGSNARSEAPIEFRRLGLLILSFWENETLAAVVLGWVRMRGESAAEMLMELAEANTVGYQVGPWRADLAAMLHLKP